jgi:hypothetical protein
MRRYIKSQLPMLMTATKETRFVNGGFVLARNVFICVRGRT